MRSGGAVLRPMLVKFYSERISRSNGMMNERTGLSYDFSKRSYTEKLKPERIG